MKWRNRKFTFMVIPDANSAVKRFHLSSFALAVAVALVLALIVSCATAVWLYRGNVSRIGQLELELSAATGDYERILEDKDVHINELQTDLADLAEQAKSMATRMKDINSLESELKEMVGLDAGSSSASRKASGAENDDGEYAMDGGTGGEELPVSDAEMNQLVDQTRESLQSLGKQIATMKPKLELTKEAVAKQLQILAVTPTIWPTDSRRITSTFGIRKDPFTGRATYHAGVDIGGKTGEPIYAAADGTVTEAGHSSSHGNNVLINHSNGIQTHYSHMSKIIATVGSKVRKGDIIGELGSTGRSTGPHLHYEVIVKGEHVDPEPYLKATRRSQ
ncbi:peptidoglycan DD-metalloendopeptidase family protein [Cohnella cellulosilytica]|uniref:Peptidoglycan DD-metalloendopeptidase family protein n=1 Tax=Cohnella cellulosilytica TaxID=986710 RepID=A0ABW2F724_9BACL